MSVLVLSILTGGQGINGLGVTGMAIMGAANGLLIPSLIRVVTTGMDPKHAGLASGILLSVQQMGAALGYVLLGGIHFSILGSGGSAEKAFQGVLFADIALTAVAAFLAATIGARQLSRPVPSDVLRGPCPEAGTCQD
jgi:MFS family permease